jgi:hypothetical protein
MSICVIFDFQLTDFCSTPYLIIVHRMMLSVAPTKYRVVE